MAGQGHKPLFLARQHYRERRLMDAARILPVAGAVLFALPVVWSGNPFRAGSTAGGGVYLFVVWAGLILGAARLSARLVSRQANHPPPDPGTGPDGDGDG